MQLSYSNNGLSFRAIGPGNLPSPGDVVFDHYATPDELTVAFPGYAAAIASQGAPVILAEKLDDGIAITSTGTPALDATYALDDDTLTEIKGVANDFASGLGLPADWRGYPDITGTMRPLDGPATVAIYKAMRDLVSRLRTQAATLASGGPPDWPDQSATIA